MANLKGYLKWAHYVNDSRESVLECVLECIPYLKILPLGTLWHPFSRNTEIKEIYQGNVSHLVYLNHFSSNGATMPRPLKGALLNLLFCQFLTRLAKFEKEIINVVKIIISSQCFPIENIYFIGRQRKRVIWVQNQP